MDYTAERSQMNLLRGCGAYLRTFKGQDVVSKFSKISFSYTFIHSSEIYILSLLSS